MVKIEAIAVDIDGTITDDTRKICISAIADCICYCHIDLCIARADSMGVA